MAPPRIVYSDSELSTLSSTSSDAVTRDPRPSRPINPARTNLITTKADTSPTTAAPTLTSLNKDSLGQLAHQSPPPAAHIRDSKSPRGSAGSAFIQSVFDINPTNHSPTLPNSTAHDLSSSRPSTKRKPALSPSPATPSPAKLVKTTHTTTRPGQQHSAVTSAAPTVANSSRPTSRESTPIATPPRSDPAEFSSVASTSAQPLAASSSASTWDTGYSRRTRDPNINYTLEPVEPEVTVRSSKSAKSAKAAKSAQPVVPKGRGNTWKEGVVYKIYEHPSPEPEPGTIYAIQTSDCQRSILSEYPQCHMCCSRQAGDICLFRGVRSFPVSSAGSDKPTGPPIFLNSTRNDDTPQFPVNYNQPFTSAHASQIKTVAARALLPTLQKELGHASQPTARRIKLGLAERSLCDTCLHAMFGAKYQCWLCGREQCLDCHAKLVQIQADAILAGEPIEPFAHGQRANLDVWRLTKCSGRRGENPIHSPSSFVPLTRFKQSELQRWVDEMTNWIDTHPVLDPPKAPANKVEACYSAGRPIDGNRAYLRVPLAQLEPQSVSSLMSIDPSSADTPLSFSPAFERPLVVPPSIDDLVAASNLFHGLWSKGETMVVGVSPKDLKLEEWSPARFVAMVGEVDCIVASNRTGLERYSTVGKFFTQFGKGDATGQSVKIKDWPSSSDFESGLPDCFKMYMNSLPFGSVTRRDGVLNIAAHYPLNANPPDLGPKGYFSEISDDEPGGNGSTKLHMDVADAVNLMLWAGPTCSGGPGFAAWDLFKAEDADKIRDFLYELIAERDRASVDHVKAMTNDPIHGQNFFLDRVLRQRLADTKGVRPWRIYQKPGEVVFIPAGCAHQVCNFADCIKIASDFVSLENVQRCEKLTDEFRLQTKDTKLWRSDVLQLKSQLLWAWRSCERFGPLEPPARFNGGSIAREPVATDGAEAQVEV